MTGALTIAERIDWVRAQVDVVCETTVGPYAARVLEHDAAGGVRVPAIGYGQSVGEALSTLGLLLSSEGVEDRRVQHLGAERIDAKATQGVVA